MINTPCRWPGCTGIYEYEDISPPDWGDLCENPVPSYFIHYWCTHCRHSQSETIFVEQTSQIPYGTDEEVRSQALADAAESRQRAATT